MVTFILSLTIHASSTFFSLSLSLSLCSPVPVCHTVSLTHLIALICHSTGFARFNWSSPIRHTHWSFHFLFSLLFPSSHLFDCFFMSLCRWLVHSFFFCLFLSLVSNFTQQRDTWWASSGKRAKGRRKKLVKSALFSSPHVFRLFFAPHGAQKNLQHTQITEKETKSTGYFHLKLYFSLLSVIGYTCGVKLLHCDACVLHLVRE